MFDSKNLGHFSRFLPALLLLTLYSAGCAMTGDTTASGPGATAIGGRSEVTVSPRLDIQVQLGDGVVKAAAEAVKGWLAGIPFPVSEQDEEEAIQQGVAAGLEKAKAEGKQVTEDQKKDLKQYVENVVRERVKGSGGP